MPRLRRVTFCRLARQLPLLASFLLGTSCSDFFVSNSATATVTVSPSALILKAATGTTPGDSFVLAASATTVGGKKTDETSAAAWTSSNSAIVTVNKGNLSVIGTTDGSTAVITATFGGQSATCQVLTYTGVAPTALTVNFPSTISPISVAPGTVFQATATASISGNSNTDISSFVTWSSNAPSIATVDATGKITVLSTPGTFTIMATANFASTTAQGTSTTFTVI